MNRTATLAPSDLIVYPESDGLPMADNTKQFRWIFVLYGNLAALFWQRTDVFVGGNRFWYPVEGHPERAERPERTSMAPASVPVKGAPALRPTPP